MKRITILALIAAASASPLRAHYLWIEPSGAKEAKMFFGEFADGQKEKSGGRLDEMTKLEFWSKSPSGSRYIPLASKKMEDHILLPEIPEYSFLFAQDLSHEVADLTKHDLGLAKPMYYARYQKAGSEKSAEPFLTLDIFLSEENAARVFYKQKPLPGAKVTVYAPNGWQKEFKSDENGKVSVSAPWPGQYVLEVIHKEPSAGNFAGKKYDSVRHRATCTVVRP